MIPFSEAKAIFFDVDDTLYDFEESMLHAFVHLRGAFPDMLGRHEVDAVSKAYWSFYRGYPEKAKYDLIHTDPGLFRLRMWAGALANLGMDEDAPFVHRLTQVFEKERPEQWRRAMYPGARDVLAALKARGTILGAITNGPTLVQRPKLEAFAYRDFFAESLVFVSGEFGERKPHPSIFEAAAKAAGVSPGDCVMVGDSREFDMPAKAVGFRTILFTGPRERPDITRDEWPPDAVVTDYREMRKLLLG